MLLVKIFPEVVSENFTGFGFNGEEQNQRTGLQYLRARYYDSQTGSFISMDSYEGDMTSPISRNRYTYAENDPIGNFDPSGHFTVKNKGISRYVDKGDINELRAFMQGAAMYQQAGSKREFLRKADERTGYKLYELRFHLRHKPEHGKLLHRSSDGRKRRLVCIRI